MHIGVVLPQVSADWDQALEAATHAEEVGADSVWVIDHVFGFPPERGILEAWAVMAAVAAVTERVEIGGQVLCQSFRNPALLAKIAATTDRIAKGRLRMLIGAGWFEQEYRAFGWDFPPARVRFEELKDAIAILKGLLHPHEGGFTYEGKHHSVHNAVNLPLPVRQPMPIEVGAMGDSMLRLIAARCDGWNSPGAGLHSVEERISFLAKACVDAGRSIDELRLSCQIVAAVGDDEAAQHPGMAMFNPSLGLIGDADNAAKRARELMSLGIKDFNCIVPPGPRGRAIVERLMNDVKPKVD